MLYACALFVVAGIRMLELQAPYSGPLLHDADQAGLFSFPARSTSAPFNCMMFKISYCMAFIMESLGESREGIL